MQLYALDPSAAQNCLILASEAEKRKNYLCPECQNFLRARGGNSRQTHFFHLKSSPNCRQHQKGIIHIQLQLYLASLLKEEGAQLEVAFPAIGRIADVACLKSNKIFEIQYSPITLVEARERTQDYARLGFTLTWLLHDHRFNKRNLTAAELFLREGSCYFTNMDERSNGTIYDQIEIIQNGKRVFRGYPLKVNLKMVKKSVHTSQELPAMIQKRVASQPFFHQGDLLDRFFSGGLSTFLFELEKKFTSSQQTFSLWKKIKEGYTILFHLLLQGVVKIDKVE